MTKYIVSVDLDQDSDPNYGELEQMMNENGFRNFNEQGEPFPSTTFISDAFNGGEAEDIKNDLWKQMAEFRLKPKNILVAEMIDSAHHTEE